MDVSPKDRLVVLHTTSSEKLAEAFRLGDLPVPSLGVTKVAFPYTDFGEVSLIGDRGLVDPAVVPVYVYDAFTPTAPRAKTGRILSAANAAEAVKRMTSPAAQRRRGLYGTGRLLADVTGRFVSMVALQAARDRVIRFSEARQCFCALDNLLDRFVLGLCPCHQPVHPVSAASRETSAMKVLVSAYRRGATRQALVDALGRRRFYLVAADLVDTGMEILSWLPHVPTPYFEAKPPRLVGLREFFGAVAPLGLPHGIRKVLRREGLTLKFYNPKVCTAQASAITALAFQLADEVSDLLYPVTTSRILFKNGRRPRRRRKHQAGSCFSARNHFLAVSQVDPA